MDRLKHLDKHILSYIFRILAVMQETETGVYHHVLVSVDEIVKGIDLSKPECLYGFSFVHHARLWMIPCYVLDNEV